MNDKQQQTWIYGILPAGATLEELERRDRLPDVWTVETGEIAAIVGEVPAQDAKATRDQALAHARVLEAAIVDAPVIPFRFGNIVPGGDDEVRSELLEPRLDEFAQILDKFEHGVQMTLKVNYNEDAVLREIFSQAPEIAELNEASRQGDEDLLRDARVRLGEAVSGAVQQLRQRDALALLELLEPVSLASVDDDLESEFMVLNAPFLVERDRIEEFEAEVERVAEENQKFMRFTLLGPMPAYDFLDAEPAAWA